MQQGLDSIQGSSGQGYFLKGLPRQGEGAGDTASLLQLAMEGKRNDLAVYSTWGLALSQNSVVLSLFYFSFPPFWYSWPKSFMPPVLPKQKPARAVSQLGLGNSNLWVEVSSQTLYYK